MADNNYNSIIDFINALNNSKVPYLILRNHENLLSPELYVDGHGDIDILCSNSKDLAEKIGAVPYKNKVKEICNDGVHYYIEIRNKHVSLDLRSIGDGYYCTKWQKDMLAHRILNNGFYIMNDKDYFYSLIHHAILQKRKFSGEYKKRLSEMALALSVNIKDDTPNSFIHTLEAYMKENGYTYSYPKDIFVPLHKKYIDSSLLESDKNLAFKHWKFDTKISILEFLVKVKHFLFK